MEGAEVGYLCKCNNYNLKISFNLKIKRVWNQLLIHKFLNLKFRHSIMESLKTVTNKDIEGKWAIFFFYPADFTFVCPTELVDIAEKYNQFKAMGVEVYSVSTDSHFVHKAWHDASESIRKITYPMLADPTGAFVACILV